MGKCPIFIFTLPFIGSNRSNLIASKLSFLFKPISFLTFFCFYLGSIIYFINELYNVQYSSQDIDYIWGFFIYLLSVLVHEFGHISALKHYGQPCGEIGLGLYLYFPCFYSDVSNAWALPPKNRMIVNLAGMYFQCIYSLPVLLLFIFTENNTFLLAFVSILFSFLFNLNPFLKFDGYWVVSDALNINNLHKVSRDIFLHLLTKKQNYGYLSYKKMNLKKRIFLIFYTIVSYSFYLLFILYIIPKRIIFFNYNTISSELKLFFTELKFPSVDSLKQTLIIAVTFFILYRIINNIRSVYKSVRTNS